MDVAAIDRSATQGRSPLHSASPKAKLAAFGLVLAAVVVSWNPLVLVALAIVLLAAAVAARLPLRLTLTLAAYPAVFAAIFAFASAPDLAAGLTIVLKAVTAALAAVVLVMTTPYPQVFAPVQRVVPSLVGDALLMTYRTFFLLAERFADLSRAIRLRSATRAGGFRRTVADTGSALGNLVLYSIDLSQRDYDVMRLRGYTGRLRATVPGSASPAADVALLVAATVSAVVAIAWRVDWRQLDQYAWLLPIPALVALAASALIPRRTS